MELLPLLLHDKLAALISLESLRLVITIAIPGNLRRNPLTSRTAVPCSAEPGHD